jgi:predicted nucleotidyltransferase component of viral defense system
MMKTINYPTNFTDLNTWAQQNSVGIQDARERFVQYSILLAIAENQTLSTNLIMKGGVALDFVWRPYRSTSDIDFSVNPDFPVDDISAERLTEWLSSGFRQSELHTGVLLAINGIDRQPPGPDKTFVTFQARVTFALPDEIKIRNQIQSGQYGRRVVKLDISINEPVCGFTEHQFGLEGLLLISSIEDIVAEKLRAILQQPIRNRSRSRDILDIANLVSSTSAPNSDQVGEFLLAKAKARNVPVSKEHFRTPEIRDYSQRDYAVLKPTVRSSYLEFEDAFSRVLAFVDTLPIPAE